MSSRELPLDRLATTDSQGNRIYLYPADTDGRWKKCRSRLSVFLIALFLFLPWIKIDGHQALLLDIFHKRFAIFGLTFWAHDAPMLIFIVGGAIITIAFTTAIWGRVWCGWACPQTVFVEQVFRKVERRIEGDAVDRKRLDESPLSFEKFIKKTFKWIVFTLLALILSHSFLAYFVGTEALGNMMKSSPSENPTPFLIMTGVTLAILFDFGWFREQFCTIVCPYGRFQSVLMDGQSTIVAYDTQRGEPRRGTQPNGSPSGDCVNCYRCVRVCPTGIDIRRGTQLECIACTACIDACDEVMSRLKKPLGLIRYGNQATTEGQNLSIPWLKRTRAWVYLALLMICIAGLAYTISVRSPIEITLIRAVDSPYQEIPGDQGQPQVVNHFKVDLRNQTFEEQDLKFSIESDLQSKGVNLITSNHKNKLAPGESERSDLFIRFPSQLLKMGRGKIIIRLESHSNVESQKIILMREAHLVGPLR